MKNQEKEKKTMHNNLITDIIRWKAELARTEYIGASSEDCLVTVKAQAMRAALEAVVPDIIRAFLDSSSVMARTAHYLHEHDNATLIALPHDSESCCIVEHGDNQLAPFKEHIKRMLDREYERIGWNAKKGALRMERVIKGEINEWKKEHE